MSRFALSRKWFVSFCALSIVFGGTSVVTPQMSYADTSWVEILKPLVKDVIVPGANAGMKKWIEKHTAQKTDSSSAVTTVDPAMAGVTIPTDATAATDATATVTTSTDATLVMPQEPMTGNDTPMLPEEPMSTSAATTQTADTVMDPGVWPIDTAMGSASEPPPPVATP